MVRATATRGVGRSRPGAGGLALALAAVWLLALQPLGHVALLRAMLQAAGPGYSIICTVDGPHLVADGDNAVATRGPAPASGKDRPLPDCCPGAGIAMSSPAVVALSFGPDSVVAAPARPLAQARPLDSQSAWRLPRPRGPPLTIL